MDAGSFWGELLYFSSELPLFGSPDGLWLIQCFLKKRHFFDTALACCALVHSLSKCRVGARLSAEHLSKDNIDFYHEVETGKNIIQGSLRTTWLLQIGRTETVQNHFLEAELCLGLTKNLSGWFEKVSSEVSVVVTSGCRDCSWFSAFLLV